MHQRVKLQSLLLRPEFDLEMLCSLSSSLAEFVASLPSDISDEVRTSSEIAIKYNRYLEKEQDVADRILKFENMIIRDDINYFSLTAISYEAREKLSKMRPHTIGQASRISGVSPADISVLIMALNS